MTNDAKHLSRNRTKEIAVSLSTRISLSSRNTIDNIVDREGISIRDVLEQAIEARWGSGDNATNAA